MPTTVRFDAFEVDLPAGQLYKHGIRINLRDKSFQVLAALLEHPGEVVTRDDLRRQLWHDEVFVDFDNNLNTAIARLREALCDSAEHPRFIETLPKRGYRFLKPVSERPDAPEKKTTPRARLIVLPFRNLSGDPAQEYFCDAITDEIITALAGFVPEQLAVIARTTAMHYKESRKDVARIGHELGVDYAVEGGVHRSGDRVSINVQLIQASDQAHLLARKYDSELRDLFKLYDRIAQAIATQLPGVAEKVREGALVGGRVARKPTDDLVAYQLYLQGRPEMGKGSPEGIARAKRFLEQAIARDPEFALAYDALAELCWYMGYLGLVSPRAAFSAGIVHALRAIEIDNSLAETHALLGQFHKLAEYNWGEVEREMALALRLDPNSPLVRMRYAVSGLMPHGRLQEAASELERALELDPLSLLARFWLGIVLMLGRRYDRAIEEAKKLLALDENYFPGHFVLATSYRYQKKFEEALAAQRRAVEFSGGAAGMLGWLGLTLAEAGDTAGARDVLRRLQGMAAERYVPPCSVAWIHLGLGEIDAAFEWLNRAVDECDQLLMPIKTYGFLDPIRSDPRYAELLRKMNLEP
jgi:TolB-like protein/Flp pilus assembly protein TadD